MKAFIPGQRVISDTEPELGLGSVEQVDARTIRIAFPASDETRIYALAEAPLHRVKFSPGDTITDQSGVSLQIENVEHDTDNLLLYHGQRENGDSATLAEVELSNLPQLNKPQERLLCGQLDNERWFRLRYETLQQLNKLSASPLRGLGGARVSLLPHQLYIAHEAAQRFAPRVLLADEVGLGKTIEAGLILHQQLLSGRAQRVLLVVPEPLMHQWLVEMLRRFNLRFSLFDQTRCEALESEMPNPFTAEQLVLCSLQFFLQQPERQTQAIEAGWDLLVVDEAHHLQWQAEAASPAYTFVEQLAQTTPGLLLLTATPEQLGAASHFARLRLIDPHRFHDLEAFLQEEAQYQPVAEAASELLDSDRLSDAAMATLRHKLADDGQLSLQLAQINDSELDADLREEARDHILNQLLDRHGTGRVLFRNTRNGVKGFPLREARAYPLSADHIYDCIHTHLSAEQTRQAFAKEFDKPMAQLMLTPEALYHTLKSLGARGMAALPDWWLIDPRVDWLVEQLKNLRKDKVLVICADPETALALEDHLRQRHALRVGVFHEGLSIVERDRAAAYFSDMQGGAQALICSEIGSEGRNFQFAHHLVLFDLPLNPDLLEQRIGRLDRIGQRHTIQIHIPYLEHSAQHVMYLWYQHGIDAFTRTCPAGAGVYAQLQPQLHALLEAQQIDTNEMDALIAQTVPVYEQINQRLQAGRDRLLELNSFRSQQANTICRKIEQQDRDTHLADYMARICDAYGVEYEHHSAGSAILRPGDHMQVHHFPELKQEAVTVCYQRELALLHEDRWFLTWEHPMVGGIIDMLLGSERGNTCVSVCKILGQKTGSILLECIFSLECVAERQLQVNDFLPPTVVRVLLNSKGEDLQPALSTEQLQGLPVDLGKQTTQQIIQSHQSLIRKLLIAAKQHAEKQAGALINQSLKRMQDILLQEHARLSALAQTNPNIREDEIQFLQLRREQLTTRIQASRLRLDALRLIIAT